MVSSKSSDVLQNVFVIGVLVLIVFVLYRCATMSCDCSDTREHFAKGPEAPGSGYNRCGTTWDAANSNPNAPQCKDGTDAACLAQPGTSCFANLYNPPSGVTQPAVNPNTTSPSPSPSPPPTPSPSPTPAPNADYCYQVVDGTYRLYVKDQTYQVNNRNFNEHQKCYKMTGTCQGSLIEGRKDFCTAPNQPKLVKCPSVACPSCISEPGCPGGQTECPTAKEKVWVKNRTYQFGTKKGPCYTMRSTCQGTMNPSDGKGVYCGAQTQGPQVNCPTDNNNNIKYCN